MKKRRNRDGVRRRESAGTSAGFSMVELMAASAAGAVLAVTAGLLLFFSSAILVRTSREQEIQRDATFAMDLLGRTVQSSRGREVTVTGGQIEFATNHVRTGRAQFYSDGQGNLVYDRNLSVAGDEIKVVVGRLAAFSATVTSNRMGVAIGLREGAKRLTLTNGFTFRNGT